MAKIGDKRSGDDLDANEESTKTTPSSGFNLMFKPSPLASVASTLTTYASKGSSSPEPSSKKLQKFTFVESNETAKSPVKFTAPSIMKVETPKSLDVGESGQLSSLKRPFNGSDDTAPSKRSNLFIECLEHSSSRPSASSGEEQQEKKDKGFLFGEQLSNRVVVNQSGLTLSSQTSNEGHKQGNGSPASSSSSSNLGVQQQRSPTVALPQVETVTGEEGERHIAQISCKLFVFDSASRNWREKGRGELRLNDTPKSEGAYQSRLIMRAGGSRRVFLNTHLWSRMKCERANERSIRVTAQEPDGGFGVYLVKSAPKDISVMFSAVSRRLDALRIASSREVDSDTAKTHEDTPPLSSTGGFDEDDSELGDRPSICSSPESSPERLMERFEKPVSTSTAYNTQGCSSAPLVTPPPCLSATTDSKPLPFTSTKDPASFTSVVSDPLVTDPVTTAVSTTAQNKPH